MFKYVIFEYIRAFVARRLGWRNQGMVANHSNFYTSITTQSLCCTRLRVRVDKAVNPVIYCWRYEQHLSGSSGPIKTPVQERYIAANARGQDPPTLGPKRENVVALTPRKKLPPTT